VAGVRRDSSCDVSKGPSHPVWSGPRVAGLDFRASLAVCHLVGRVLPCRRVLGRVGPGCVEQWRGWCVAVASISVVGLHAPGAPWSAHGGAEQSGLA